MSIEIIENNEQIYMLLNLINKELEKLEKKIFQGEKKNIDVIENIDKLETLKSKLQSMIK